MTGSTLRSLLTIHAAVAIGCFAVFAGLVAGFGYTQVVSSTSQPPALAIAATIFGSFALAAYFAWLVVFLKHHRERPVPDGAEPVELIEE